MAVAIKETRGSLDQKIADCTSACIEKTRKAHSFIGLTLRPRRYFEPKCKEQCNQQYAADMAALDAQEAADKNSMSAAIQALANPVANQYKLLVFTFLFIIIIAIIIS